MPQDIRVGVGVAVLVYRTNQETYETEVLLGKRKGVHLPGYYATPGGWLEFGETMEACASRELKEEVGIDLGKAHFGQVCTSSKILEGRHLVTVYYETWLSQDVIPKNMEPDKCKGWKWFDVHRLPTPIWPDIQEAIFR